MTRLPMLNSLYPCKVEDTVLLNDMVSQCMKVLTVLQTQFNSEDGGGRVGGDKIINFNFFQNMANVPFPLYGHTTAIV